MSADSNTDSTPTASEASLPSERASSAADRLVMILVEPQHPGNVGAAARAMKNMGLHRLVVVDPPALDPMRVRWMAPGCDDVVRDMRVVKTLDEALDGVHTAIATTARHRRGHQPVLDPATFATRCWDEEAALRDGTHDGEPTVRAVLFGREDFGLSRADTDRCAALLRIPTPEHASLNLGQAVLLIAHAWFETGRRRGLAEAPGRTLGGRRDPKPTRQLQTGDRRDARADLPRIDPAAAALVELLERVGYTRSTPPERVLQTARSSLQKARVSIREVEALRGMIARITWALEHPEE